MAIATSTGTRTDAMPARPEQDPKSAHAIVAPSTKRSRRPLALRLLCIRDTRRQSAHLPDRLDAASEDYTFQKIQNYKNVSNKDGQPTRHVCELDARVATRRLP